MAEAEGAAAIDCEMQVPGDFIVVDFLLGEPPNVPRLSHVGELTQDHFTVMPEGLKLDACCRARRLT